MVCRIFITISVLVGLHAGCTLGHSTQSIVALILARGGSKGIPLKNIVEIQPNQTLLGRTLDTLRRSEVFKEVWVSTDHERIALEAELHGASVFARSATHAQDHSSSLDATREFLEAHPEIDRFALVQCTSPFLRVHYLEQAAAQTCATTDDIVRWGSSCAFSVVRSHKLRWRKSETDGRLEPINFDLRARPRRQDWPGELVETGMFYFTDRQLVMEEESFQSYTCTVVEVDELDALEIDDMKDLEVARLLIGME